MLKKTIDMGAAAVAAALMLCVIAPANAIVVGGRWDPKYGAPFEGANPLSVSDDMWWSGDALFTIPDAPACAATAANNYLVTCAGMFVSSANVYLSIGEGGTVVDTLEFDGTLALGKVKFAADGKTVRWVESNWWNPLEAASGTEFNLSQYLFSLNFTQSGAGLFHAEKAFLDRHGNHRRDGDTYFWNGRGVGHIGKLCDPSTSTDGLECGFSNTLGRMTFFAIPEPSTYALLFASIGAFGLSALRRRPPHV